MAASPFGVVLLNKGEGDSSFGALSNVKRLFSTRRVGHTGTLDPMATGLLIALVGPATRCARYFNGLPKSYVGEVTFGSETDTDDRTGTTIRSAPPPRIESVASAADTFIGTFAQVPPAYSAVHVNGERAYRKAREGEPVEIAARKVTIHSLVVEVIDSDRVRLHVSCSSGTYIRSLARDLGRSLGSAAHLSALQRTHVGPFSVDEVEGSSGSIRALPLLPCLLRIPGFSEFTVSDRETGIMRNGGRIAQPASVTKSSPPDVVATNRGMPIAIGRWADGRFEYDLVLPPGDDPAWPTPASEQGVPSDGEARS